METPKFITGFESTKFMHPDTRDGLEITGHYTKMAEDLRLVKESGIDMLRYPAPWHNIEKEPGKYDWSWMDLAVEEGQKLGLDFILDPLHHTSLPLYLKDGFNDSEFPDRYLAFLAELAQRYPHIDKYTPINEPYATVFLCGLEGEWHPYHKSMKEFVPMMITVAKTLCRATTMLREINPNTKIIQTDSCEVHTAYPDASKDVQDYAELCNNRRFICDDMITGIIVPEHPLYTELAKNGYDAKTMQWFQDHAIQIDVRGLDYYALAEWRYADDHKEQPSTRPVGFAEAVKQYRDHYVQFNTEHIPEFWLTETNIRGYYTDRITWMKFMFDQCMKADIPVFGWFPFIDSRGWAHHMLRLFHTGIDPTGILYADEHIAESRNMSELYEKYTGLASGLLEMPDIPAYVFQPPLDSQLKGFLPLMDGYEWIDPPPEPIEDFVAA